MTQQPRTILIIGGGIAGTAAALHVAGAGHRALLVDEAPALGGALLLLDKTFPTDSCGVCFLAPETPALCPFLECEREPSIDIRPLTRLEMLEGEPGAFKATLTAAPRKVDVERCTACGLCVDACPETVDAGLLGAEWLGERHKAIYQPFPQAIPPAYVIDPAGCTRCGKCVEACPFDAIDLDAQPATETVEVASVVLAPGFGPNNAKVRGAYGYGEYQNVITSLEYERMLSTGSPSKGSPIRPSDGRPARKVAIIHCAGSRDQLHGVPYCSAGCCMIAAKQASLTQKRAPGVQVDVFTMDLRAAGRTYQRYLSEIQSRRGITYRRSLVSAVKLDPATQGLTLQYAEDGRSRAETYDLIVLQVGMVAPQSVRELAERIGVQVNQYGFAATESHAPTLTSRPGVFVAGAWREPKDVPSTAAEATAAAAQALGLAGVLPIDQVEVDGQKTNTALAVSTPTIYQQPRIGVFIDASDADLVSSLDANTLMEQIAGLPDVVHVGQSTSEETLRAAIAENKLTHLIVGRRSARRNGHPSTVEGVPVTPVALGAVDAFVHIPWPALASRKALELVSMAVEQARWAAARPIRAEWPEPCAMVLGGGVAGLLAARSLAQQGFPVDVVEQSSRLGGWLVQGEPPAYLADWMAGVEADAAIKVHLNSQLKAIDGRPGHLSGVLSTPQGDVDVTFGALVVAIGAQEHRPDGYGNGAVTQRDLDGLIAGWRQSANAPASVPASVVMIQCAGTRNTERSYCSKTCCVDAIKHALTIKHIAPETRVAILFRDIVTPGFSEDLYTEARRQGVLFVRYTLDSPPRIDGRKVSVVDDVLKEQITLDADLLVLSSGIAPALDTSALADVLGVELDGDGFFKPVNIKSQMMDLNYPGLYLAGLAGGPASPEETIEQGAAAGLRAALFLRRGLKTPTAIAVVDETICSGCGLCLAACPTGARHLDAEKGVAVVDPWLCTGCGVCAAACPNGAAGQALYEARGVLNAVDAALGK